MPRSTERKRLQCGRGVSKGLEDCRSASIGVQGSAESRGRDSYKYYRNPHSTQLANAIIHDKAHKVNKGKFYRKVVVCTGFSL